MERRLETVAVHGGEDRDGAYDALTMPIVMSSTYTFSNTRAVREFVERKTAGDRPERYEYGRYGNPTQSAAERKLAALDGGERALLFSSGMAAITTSLLTLLSSGDHLVLVGGVYRRTREFARAHLPRFGIEVTESSAEVVADAIRPTTRAILLEVPTNPYLRVPDVEAIVELARRHGLLTAVDATFATPVNLRPLDLGVDVVFHSATKYIGGHNDLLAGTVVGAAERLAPIEEARGVFGAVAGPLDAYLVLRGAKTLPLRVRAQNESAGRLAAFLAEHPAVDRVHYPGLPSHPDHAVARRLMSGFGGVVSFELVGGLDVASTVIDRLSIPAVGPTFGGAESVVQQQALFISPDPAERTASGIADGLIRYAVGLESVDDLIDDLRDALRGLPEGRGSE
jgi:cystathionine gamma-synthase